MPADRDADPVGPVVELVADLVERLLEQVGVELDAPRRACGRPGGGRVPSIAREVAARGTPPTPTPPTARRGRRAARARCSSLRTVRARRLRRSTDVRRVVERAQHAGDVAERRPLQAPLAERARRFAFEVEDDEVAPGRTAPDRGGGRRGPGCAGRRARASRAAAGRAARRCGRARTRASAAPVAESVPTRPLERAQRLLARCCASTGTSSAARARSSARARTRRSSTDASATCSSPTRCPSSSAGGEDAAA